MDELRTHLSLFSGIGGLDIAAEWAGFTTVGQCEWADYPTKVLEKHWPDVPRWRDIRTLTGDSFYDKTNLRTVDIISGGFPCQPFSVAGKQAGKSDDRYLWPEMLRVIRAITPRWVVSENVPGILRIAAADVVQDLEREGYNVVVFDFEAAAVGAVHRRERVAFVANRYSDRSESWRAKSAGQQRENGTANGGAPMGRDNDGQPDGRDSCHSVTGTDERPNAEPGRSGRILADTCGTGLSRGEQLRTSIEESRTSSTAAKCCSDVCNSNNGGCAGNIGRENADKPTFGRWWAAEPDVGRVAHGVPNRVDRLKCLGNAVVPQQFYPIFKAITDAERGEE